MDAAVENAEGQNREQMVQQQGPVAISNFVRRDVCRRWWESAPFKYSCQQVHDSWDYHDTIRNNSTYLAHSIFLNHFVIKCLAFNHGKECIDYRAEAVIAQPEKYGIGERRVDIVRHYEIFKSRATNPMDNIDTVEIVSLAHSIYYNLDVPDPDNFDISREILLRIRNYLNQPLYDNIETYVRVEYGGLIGNVNMIFHDERGNIRNLYHIKVSRTDHVHCTLLEAQLNAYRYCRERGTTINKVIVYRALPGIAVTMDAYQIDFHRIEEIVRQQN